MTTSSVRVRLIILTGARVGEELEVVDAAIIGRQRTCDLRLDATGVSREHAKIRVDDGAVWVEDLQSSNGVKLRGNRVHEARLSDGDELHLGKARIKVRIDSPEAVAPPPSAASVPADFDELTIEEGELEERPEPAARRAAPPPAPVGSRPAPASRPAASAKVAAPARDASVVGGGSGGRTRGGALQYNRVEGRGGVFADDVGQSGFLTRLVIVAIVLAVGALVFWLAYTGI